MPVVGGCKRVAVEATRKVVERFPGRVREVGCVRACGCGSGSDHCCGKAVDLMCSDAGGVSPVFLLLLLFGAFLRCWVGLEGLLTMVMVDCYAFWEGNCGVDYE